MAAARKVFFTVVLALLISAGQSAFAKPRGEKGDEGREHRHITGTAMNDAGFLAALASGIGTYLLIRRRAYRK